MSNSTAMLLAGRAITGFCAGVFTPAGQLYLSEIASPKYRGFFLASIAFNAAFGILITHSLAFVCSWDVNAIICGMFPFIGYIVTTFCGPESPSFLLPNSTEKACEAFLWLRGCGDEANNEFRTMVDAQVKNAAEISAQCEDDKQHKTNFNFYPIIRITKLIANKPFYVPLIILSIYFATLQFSGKDNSLLFWNINNWRVYCAWAHMHIIIRLLFSSLRICLGANSVIFYTHAILKDSLGANRNEYVATTIIDIVRMVAALIACVVVKNVQRRTLTIFSGASTAICLFSLSFYLNLSTDNSLKSYVSIPFGLFVLYTLVISIGLMPLPWCLTGECKWSIFILNIIKLPFLFICSKVSLCMLFIFPVFPLRFRAVGSALVTFFNFVCFFGVVKTSPIYFDIYGSSKMFLLYGIFTLIGTSFLVALLPETKNKTLQEIEQDYTNTSKRKHKMNRNKIQP